jgi:mRNA interferase RelE/StbE
MENYKIYFKKSAKKELEETPQPDLGRIIKKIEVLRHQPRIKGTEKLSGEDKYRLRQGNYRVIYSIHDAVKEIWIVKIAHRKDVYQKI